MLISILSSRGAQLYCSIKAKNKVTLQGVQFAANFRYSAAIGLAAVCLKIRGLVPNNIISRHLPANL